jgi:hypothetical protein
MELKVRVKARRSRPAEQGEASQDQEVILNNEEEVYLKEEQAGTKREGSSTNLIFQISAKGE